MDYRGAWAGEAARSKEGLGNRGVRVVAKEGKQNAGSKANTGLRVASGRIFSPQPLRFAESRSLKDREITQWSRNIAHNDQVATQTQKEESNSPSIFSHIWNMVFRSVFYRRQTEERTTKIL